MASTTETHRAATATLRGDGPSRLRLAGSLLVVAGGVILLGIITAEALYPAPYSTGGNEISDLGGTEPPGSIVLQPSATIFDLSMIAVGLLVIVAAALYARGGGRRSVAVPMAILGVGAFGVGVFPGSTGTPHALFALATFIAGGVAALAAGGATAAPFRYLSFVLGAITLLTLASYSLLGDANPMNGLGIGGIERWIVYPIVVWVTAFGGYLAGTGPATPRRDGSEVAGR